MISWREVLAWVLLAIAAILGVSAYIHIIRLESKQEARELIQAETEKFRAQNAVPMQSLSADQIRLIVHEALGPEIERIQKAIPGTKVTGGAQVKSEPIKGTVEIPAAEPGACPIQVPVTFEVGSVAAKLEGPAGAQALIGSIELWQTEPPPKRLFGSAPFKSDASQYFKLDTTLPTPPTPPKWHAELRAGLDTDSRFRLGGTYFGRTRLGAWGEVSKSLSDPTLSPTLAGGIALRLGK